MASLTRGPKAIARYLANSLSSERKHTIKKNHKGHQVEIFTSLANDGWEAWAQVRAGRKAQDTNTLNLITLGHKTEHEAQRDSFLTSGLDPNSA